MIGSIILDAVDFGAAVRKRRKKLGYTQVKVAALCGSGVRYISDLENGKETAELGKALTVAAALGIDIIANERGTPA